MQQDGKSGSSFPHDADGDSDTENRSTKPLICPLVKGLLTADRREAAFKKLGVVTQRERESWLSAIAFAERRREEEGDWIEWTVLLVFASKTAEGVLTWTVDQRGELTFESTDGGMN